MYVNQSNTKVSETRSNEISGIYLFPPAFVGVLSWTVSYIGAFIATDRQEMAHPSQSHPPRWLSVRGRGLDSGHGGRSSDEGEKRTCPHISAQVEDPEGA